MSKMASVFQWSVLHVSLRIMPRDITICNVLWGTTWLEVGAVPVIGVVTVLHLLQILHLLRVKHLLQALQSSPLLLMTDRLPQSNQSILS